MRNGRVTWLHNSDDRDIVTFERSDDQQEFVVVINFSNRPAKGQVDIVNAGDFKPVAIDGMPKAAAGDFPLLHLSGFDWRIYRRVVPPVEHAVAGTIPVQIDSTR